MRKLKLKLKSFAVLGVVLGLLIFFHFIGFLNPIENFLLSTFKPIGDKFYSAGSGIRNIWVNQSKKQDLAAELKKLRNETNQLKVEKAKLKTVQEENKKLRNHLDFLQENQIDNYAIAKVISLGLSADIKEEEESIIISKGGKDGLLPGLIVTDSQGVVIGKVAETKKEISRIDLITNENCKIASTIQNKDKTMGIAQGELGLAVNMNFIPQSEEVKLGDLVVTSGLEKNIPRGLLIGEVSQIDTQSNKIWQKVNIEPLVNFDDLVIVSVLTP